MNEVAEMDHKVLLLILNQSSLSNDIEYEIGTFTCDRNVIGPN